MYGQHATDIVGYTYAADVFCPDHIVYMVTGNGNDYDTETTLGLLASARGIERMDEKSFDSDEFPKVVFASDAWQSTDVCGWCGHAIVTTDGE
jgi:hypothetical protein